MALGVVFNGESGLFHGLYYQDVADDGHGSGRSRGRHAQYAYFLGFSGAKAYIGFVCQGAVGVSGDDDELQSGSGYVPAVSAPRFHEFCPNWR